MSTLDVFLTVLVSFGAGMIIGLLVSYQIKENIQEKIDALKKKETEFVDLSDPIKDLDLS